jgi:hypothetical protein
MQDLQLVIEKAHAIRGEELSGEKAQDLAWTVLNHFGYSDRCLSNGLDQDENAVFCYLEDLGILKPESRVDILPESSMEWRIVQWTYDAWGIEKISRWTAPDPADSLQDLYASLPPEAFAPDSGEDAPETPGEMTVQLVPEEGAVAVVNGGSEEMENGKIVSESLKERIGQIGKERVSQKFMESILKDLSGGERVNGYGTVQELVRQGFLKPDGDDGYLVLKTELDEVPEAARVDLRPDLQVRRCGVCGMGFGTQQSLMIHMSAEHPFDEDLLKVLAAKGMSIREIARQMHRGKSTVLYHMDRIRERQTAAAGDPPAEAEAVGDMKIDPDPLRANHVEEIRQLRSEIGVLEQKYQDAVNEKAKLRSDLMALDAAPKQPAGTLLSSAYIKHFDGYYDGQRKMISSIISDEITRGGKGKEISIEVWDLPPERHIILKVRDSTAPEVQA